MRHTDLRVALFSGNYNYQRDGANQALNCLVGFLEAQGVAVRVYSPTSETPAFEPTGTLVSVPSIRIPGRGDYRFAYGLHAHIKADVEAFAPNLIHLSVPDRLAFRMKKFGAERGIPVVASVHTRFDTYLGYYGLGWVNRYLTRLMRRFYSDLAQIYAPSESMADVLRADAMSDNIAIWSRGVDRTMFNPGKRSLDWRRGLGIGDNERVVAFVGRLVLEKGLDVFADTVDRLTEQGVDHQVVVVGDGPARGWAEQRMPRAIFTGHQADDDLARAYASSDMLFNPSTTETFGNVTLEAMACGLPVVAARATGSSSLVHHGISGQLVTPGDIDGYARALRTYLTDPRAAQMAGEAGLALSGRYDWDAINQSMLDHYMDVVNGDTAPAAVPLVERIVTRLRAA